eukprot:2489641-Rhodomonas_salina.2
MVTHLPQFHPRICSMATIPAICAHTAEIKGKLPFFQTKLHQECGILDNSIEGHRDCLLYTSDAADDM